MTTLLDLVGIIVLFAGAAIWVALLRKGLANWREQSHEGSESAEGD